MSMYFYEWMNECILFSNLYTYIYNKDIDIINIYICNLS